MKRGRLRRSVPIGASPHLFVKGSSEGETFGTYELVDAIKRAAAHVAEGYPGVRLNVGDLSRRSGGRLRPHRSHRRGLDVDLGFYVLDERGEPVEVRRFVRMDDAGLSVDPRAPGYRIDLARSWALVADLLEGENVQYIFVADPLKELLLMHATLIDAPASLLDAARIALEQPRGARHDDHFHVRLYCPEDDRPACQDVPPYRPWYSR